MKRDLWTELETNRKAMTAAKSAKDEDAYKRLQKERRELVRRYVNLSAGAWELVEKEHEHD